MTLRRTTIFKLCAVWLLALAISPFTAPFSTCGFAEVAGEGTTYEGASLKFKLSPVNLSDRADRRQILQAILRL